MDKVDFVKKCVEKYSDISIKAANNIWDYAETGFNEHKSSKELINALSSNGFIIESPVAGISTAFVAKYGHGGPVIGLLAEYDALSASSQVAGVTHREELTSGGNGHGCGHNLLGSACLSAALTVKDYIDECHKSGTIIVFGCPAEENGSGKTFMAREGIFDNVDIALSWHPNDWNGVVPLSTQANVQIRYSFTGKSSHAAVAPYMGRSALDAVELMDVGANYLREHVTDDVKFHYAVTDTGGISPNVVQPHAEVLYLIRAKNNDVVMQTKNRIDNIAKGAALMTGTQVDIKLIKASSEVHINPVVGKKIVDTMYELGNPVFGKEEQLIASDFSSVLEKPGPSKAISPFLNNNYPEFKDITSKVINDQITPYYSLPLTGDGSSDVGDVSLICPTVMFFVSTCAQGTVLHSWQMTAQNKTCLAHVGMLYASKVMALTAIHFIDDAKLVKEAWDAHKTQNKDYKYICPIPKETPLPIN